MQLFIHLFKHYSFLKAILKLYHAYTSLENLGKMQILIG